MLDTKKKLKAYRKTMQFLLPNDNTPALTLSRLKTGGGGINKTTFLTILEYFSPLLLDTD